MAAGPSVLLDQAWQERAFVTITKKGGSDVNFGALLNEIGWSGGEKDVEGQPLMNAGRQRQITAQSDFEFSGTLYPIGVSTGNPDGIAEFFHGGSDQLDSNNSAAEFETDTERPEFRIAVMFTNDDNVASATDEVSGTDNKAYRWIAKDALLTGYEPNFDDMIFSVDVTFVVPPFDETGASLVREQEYTGDSSDVLSSLSSYS